MEGSEGAVSLTPEQMGESITRFLQSVDSSDPKDLVNELFQEDGEFSELLIRSVPGIVGAATQMVKSFAESLENMPADKSAGLLEKAMSQVDGAEIGEAVNAMTRLLIRLHERNPELYPESKIGITTDMVEAMDFGKLRKAIIYRSEERTRFLRNEIELMGEEPMAVINLFSVITPMINNLLDVIKAAMETMELPPEAMAYVTLKILQDINWKDLTEIVNGAAGLTVTLHRGNLVLGDGSLESRTAFSRISEDVIANLNPQEIAEAIQAMGEEGEALLTSLANAVLENEELTLWMAGALTMVTNSWLTVAANVLEKANTLPAETLRKITENMAGDFEARELGRALNNLVVLAGRMRSENPELPAIILKNILSESDLGERLSPQAVGEGVNRTLISYNRFTRENPSLVTESMDGFLSGIDPQQFGQAVETTTTQVAAAASRHPEMIKAAFKALISMIYKSIREYIRNLRRPERKKEREVKVG